MWLYVCGFMITHGWDEMRWRWKTPDCGGGRALPCLWHYHESVCVCVSMISVKKDSSFFFLLLSLFPSFSLCFDECQLPFSKGLAWLDYYDVPYYGNNHVAIPRPLGNLTTKPTSWVWDTYLFLGRHNCSTLEKLGVWLDRAPQLYVY